MIDRVERRINPDSGGGAVHRLGGKMQQGDSMTLDTAPLGAREADRRRRHLGDLRIVEIIQTAPNY